MTVQAPFDILSCLARASWRWLGLLGLFLGSLYAGPPRVPAVIEYGGRVAVDGQLFTSTSAEPGYFKCVVLTESGEPLWSNDGFSGDANGSSAPGSLEPIGVGFPLSIPAAIRLEDGSGDAPYAENGHFKLRLGAGLNPFAPEVFAEGGTVASGLRLRIWFSPDNLGSYEQLSPDVALDSAPFALWAARAESVRSRLTSQKLQDDAVTTNKIKNGAVTSAKLLDGAMTFAKVKHSFEAGRLSDSSVAAPTLDHVTQTWNVDVAFGEVFDVPPIIEADGWTVESVDEAGFAATIGAEFVSRPVFGAASGSFQASETALAEVDGRPAIAWWEFPGNGLRFAIADDPDGLSWSEPVNVASNIGQEISLAEIDGRPAICCYGWAGAHVFFVIADDPSGTSWGTPVELGTTGIGSSLALVDGHPAVVFAEYATNPPELQYVRANDAGGNTWAAPVLIESEVYSGLLASVNGRPAVVYTASNGVVKFAIADDASGMVWQKTEISGVGNVRSLAVVDGRPAIAFGSGADLKYVIAGNENGTVWPPENIRSVDSATSQVQEVSLTMVDDHPAICYRAGAIKYVISHDSSGETWGAPIEIGFGDSPSLAGLDGRPGVGFVTSSHPSGVSYFGVAFATTPRPVGRWEASEPGEETVVGGLATTVVDGSITSASLADDVGKWVANGQDVFYNAGSVGIGTSTPAGTLHVVGTAGNNTGTWSNYSDRRLKEDIAPIEAGSLERLLQLEGVWFDYGPDELRRSYEHSQRGWIAQDVETVFPEWVSEAPDGMKMLTPVGFEALAVEALRELRAESRAAVSALERELKREQEVRMNLDARNGELKRRLAEMQRQRAEVRARVAELRKRHEAGTKRSTN